MSLFTFSASAAGFLDFRDESFRKEDLKEKKWIFNMGVDYMQYPTSLPAYDGTHANIKNEENYNIFGVNLGVGREFALGAGISTTLKTGGFYNKSFERNVGKASEDIDMDLANIRTDHMVYGGEASASLNYLVENKVLNFQPFLEFGLGAGVADVEKEYTFEGIEADRSDAEKYNVSAQEGFNYTKTSLGVNFISQQGVVSYIKATRMLMDVNQREIAGAINGEAQDSKEENLDENKEILSGSVGFGFLF